MTTLPNLVLIDQAGRHLINLCQKPFQSTIPNTITPSANLTSITQATSNLIHTAIHILHRTRDRTDSGQTDNTQYLRDHVGQIVSTALISFCTALSTDQFYHSFSDNHLDTLALQVIHDPLLAEELVEGIASVHQFDCLNIVKFLHQSFLQLHSHFSPITLNRPDQLPSHLHNFGAPYGHGSVWDRNLTEDIENAATTVSYPPDKSPNTNNPFHQSLSLQLHVPDSFILGRECESFAIPTVMMSIRQIIKDDKPLCSPLLINILQYLLNIIGPHLAPNEVLQLAQDLKVTKFSHRPPAGPSSSELIRDLLFMSILKPYLHSAQHSLTLQTSFIDPLLSLNTYYSTKETAQTLLNDPIMQSFAKDYSARMQQFHTDIRLSTAFLSNGSESDLQHDLSTDTILNSSSDHRIRTRVEIGVLLPEGEAEGLTIQFDQHLVELIVGHLFKEHSPYPTIETLSLRLIQLLTTLEHCIDHRNTIEKRIFTQQFCSRLISQLFQSQLDDITTKNNNNNNISNNNNDTIGPLSLIVLIWAQSCQITFTSAFVLLLTQVGFKLASIIQNNTSSTSTTPLQQQTLVPIKSLIILFYFIDPILQSTTITLPGKIKFDPRHVAAIQVNHFKGNCTRHIAPPARPITVTDSHLFLAQHHPIDKRYGFANPPRREDVVHQEPAHSQFQYKSSFNENFPPTNFHDTVDQDYGFTVIGYNSQSEIDQDVLGISPPTQTITSSTSSSVSTTLPPLLPPLPPHTPLKQRKIKQKHQKRPLNFAGEIQASKMSNFAFLSWLFSLGEWSLFSLLLNNASIYHENLTTFETGLLEMEEYLFHDAITKKHFSSCLWEGNTSYQKSLLFPQSTNHLVDSISIPLSTGPGQSLVDYFPRHELAYGNIIFIIFEYLVSSSQYNLPLPLALHILPYSISPISQTKINTDKKSQNCLARNDAGNTNQILPTPGPVYSPFYHNAHSIRTPSRLYTPIPLYLLGASVTPLNVSNPAVFPKPSQPHQILPPTPTHNYQTSILTYFAHFRFTTQLALLKAHCSGYDSERHHHQNNSSNSNNFTPIYSPINSLLPQILNTMQYNIGQPFLTLDEVMKVSAPATKAASNSHQLPSRYTRGNVASKLVQTYLYSSLQQGNNIASGDQNTNNNQSETNPITDVTPFNTASSPNTIWFPYQSYSGGPPHQVYLSYSFHFFLNHSHTIPLCDGNIDLFYAKIRQIQEAPTTPPDGDDENGTNFYNDDVNPSYFLSPTTTHNKLTLKFLTDLGFNITTPTASNFNMLTSHKPNQASFDSVPRFHALINSIPPHIVYKLGHGRGRRGGDGQYTQLWLDDARKNISRDQQMLQLFWNSIREKATKKLTDTGRNSDPKQKLFQKTLAQIAPHGTVPDTPFTFSRPVQSQRPDTNTRIPWRTALVDSTNYCDDLWTSLPLVNPIVLHQQQQRNGPDNNLPHALLQQLQATTAFWSHYRSIWDLFFSLPHDQLDLLLCLSDGSTPLENIIKSPIPAEIKLVLANAMERAQKNRFDPIATNYHFPSISFSARPVLPQQLSSLYSDFHRFGLTPLQQLLIGSPPSLSSTRYIPMNKNYTDHFETKKLLSLEQVYQLDATNSNFTCGFKSHLPPRTPLSISNSIIYFDIDNQYQSSYFDSAIPYRFLQFRQEFNRFFKFSIVQTPVLSQLYELLFDALDGVGLGGSDRHISPIDVRPILHTSDTSNTSNTSNTSDSSVVSDISDTFHAISPPRLIHPLSEPLQFALLEGLLYPTSRLYNLSHLKQFLSSQHITPDVLLSTSFLTISVSPTWCDYAYSPVDLCRDGGYINKEEQQQITVPLNSYSTSKTETIWMQLYRHCTKCTCPSGTIKKKTALSFTILHYMLILKTAPERSYTSHFNPPRLPTPNPHHNDPAGLQWQRIIADCSLGHLDHSDPSQQQLHSQQPRPSQDDDDHQYQISMVYIDNVFETVMEAILDAL